MSPAATRPRHFRHCRSGYCATYRPLHTFTQTGLRVYNVRTLVCVCISGSEREPICACGRVPWTRCSKRQLALHSLLQALCLSLSLALSFYLSVPFSLFSLPSVCILTKRYAGNLLAAERA